MCAAVLCRTGGSAVEQLVNPNSAMAGTIRVRRRYLLGSRVIYVFIDFVLMLELNRRAGVAPIGRIYMHHRADGFTRS